MALVHSDRPHGPLASCGGFGASRDFMCLTYVATAMSDTMTKIAEDVVDHLTADDREEEWERTYDVRLFGQKYTVRMMVGMTLVGRGVPFLEGGIRLGTQITMVMLANTDQVTEVRLDYTENPRDLADTLRQEVAMAHGRRMNQMDFDEFGNTLF